MIFEETTAELGCLIAEYDALVQRQKALAEKLSALERENASLKVSDGAAATWHLGEVGKLRRDFEAAAASAEGLRVRVQGAMRLIEAIEVGGERALKALRLSAKKI